MPMLNEQVIADNLALIDRNRELERELAQLKARLGAVSRIADELHEDAAKLVELCGDGPMPRNVAQACSFKFWLAREIRKAIL